MAKHRFTATHGVHLWDLGVHFKRTESRVDSDGKGHAVYAFETDDAKTATALRKVDGYGITEDAGSKSDDAKSDD
jgi:hypothetical protein